MRKIISLLIAMTLQTTVLTAEDRLSLEDFTVNRTFAAKTVQEIKSSRDGLYYTTLSQDKRSILRFSFKTGTLCDTLFSLDNVECPAKAIDDYELNVPGTWLLLRTGTRYKYRRSYSADYYIYEFRNKDILPLSENGSQSCALFSPTGTKIAFARENNLFIHDLRFHSEIKITRDGADKQIINGIPDWVYEEEFEFDRAFEWSPDGEALAFIKFNENDVKDFKISIYDGEYPSEYTYKYPVAGEANSKTTVHVYDCYDRTTLRMDIGEDSNIYIPRIKWTRDPKKLAILRLNRHQNKLEVLSANSKTGETSVIYREENKYYINNANFDAMTFLPDGKSMLVINEEKGYRQLKTYAIGGGLQKNITPAEFDVDKYYGYDPVRKAYYFSSYEENSKELHVYSLDYRGIRHKISTEKGVNDAVFSSTFNGYIMKNSSSSTLPSYKLFSSKGKLVRTLEDNAELKQTLEGYRLPVKEFIELKAADGTTALNASVLKPHDFSASKRYPVLITQYSGPYSQQVKDCWQMSWLDYVAQEGIIVVTIDPRGTAGKGENFGKCTYMQLGRLESDDIIACAKQLVEQSWADAGRIGIWGWSYGGFISALCSLKGEGLFKMGIAVAPVTNYRFYDSIYTERYMREPDENNEGYDDNSPIHYAVNLSDKTSLLLVHGTADDNVHIVNTYALAEALTQAEKQFDMAIYKDRRHGISGGNTTSQLYKRFIKYMEDHLVK